MVIPPFTPKTDWKAPNLADMPSWKEAKRICVDLETRDPTLTKIGPGVRRDGYIIGVGFAIEDGPAHYLPIRHANGTNLDSKKVLEYIGDQAKIFKGDLCGANLPYDLDYLAEKKIDFSPRYYRDTGVAEPLLDELQYSYGLDAIARRRGIPGKDETHLKAAAAAWGVNPKSGMWELPPEHVGEYAEQDCRLPMQLLRQQERELQNEGLWDVWNLESKLLPVLLKMRRRGIRVDFDRLAEIEEWAIGRETSALAKLTHITGIALTTSDTAKTSALAPLVESQGYVVPTTEKGNASIKNDWLRTLDNDVAREILVARKFNKLRTTFVESIKVHAIGDRIHCTFKQMIGESDAPDGDSSGARYGRLACKDPNLQQQPARDPEIGAVWRSIYIADEGGQIAVHDYSQQEPRRAVAYAEALRLPRAFEMAERYRTDPTADNHDMMATLINPNWPNLSGKQAKEERSAAKVIFLGLSYGMGPGKLARSLGLPTEMKEFTTDDGEVVRYMGAGPEAQLLLDRFRDGVPFVKKLMKAAEKKAKQRGYVTTAGGRRCRFARVWNTKRRCWEYEDAHKAGNRIVQGSAGDQTREAMVNADAEGIPLQLQVHDELTHTIWSPEEALHCREIMEAALPCSVPSKVDIEVGANWGDISEPDWAKR
jgi:DNA polymerase I-like protein with 3'-5' exonuclease and polymerase domains